MATFLSLTEVKMQRHFKTNIPELHSCTQTHLCRYLFSARLLLDVLTDRAGLWGKIVGIVSGLSFRKQVVLKSHRVFEAISIEMLRRQMGISSFGEPVIFWENIEPYNRIFSFFSLGCCNQRLHSGAFWLYEATTIGRQPVVHCAPFKMATAGIWKTIKKYIYIFR